MRETFAYGGGARDPFASLINTDTRAPRSPISSSWASTRTSGRRPTTSPCCGRRAPTGSATRCGWETSWAGSRLAQIRARDVVFTIQDFGYERQETLSLRKQEDVTP